MKSGLLEGLLGRPLAQVLAALCMRPEGALYQSEIVRATGLRSQQVQRALARLVGLGIVVAQPRGNRVYYRANAEIPIFAELREMIVKTAGLVDVLREALEGLEGLSAAFVYGSFAGGKDTAESDVDLLIVGEVSFREVSGRLRGAQERLAREVNSTVYSGAEFRQKAGEGHHFVTRVLEGPKLFVVGDADVLERLAGARVGDKASGDA